MIKPSLIVLPLFLALLGTASAQYQGWRHSGSIHLLTTADGADLPASCSEEDFPVLVRLDRDSFPFGEAKPGGEDLRFSSASGTPLAYEIEEWDATAGSASVWVRLPTIKGNATQEIRVHWGKADAATESSGSAVFNESNGYLSVWHMNDPVKDVVGTLASKDNGTSATAGVIGQARHFAGGQGVFGGEDIVGFPSGATPHSTEIWFKTQASNLDLVCWGREGGSAGKVRMQLQSPPHIYVDSDGGSIHAEGVPPASQWSQVVHTYDGEMGQIFLNGKLDVRAPTKTTMNIQSPARLWIGGWYHGYNFVGDIDEVRVSKVARSADWVRLQFENQKPLQTLVGPLVTAGSGGFSVSPAAATISEGGSATFSARAGGARHVSWSLLRDGVETVVSTGRLSFTFDAGRVAGDVAATLVLKAVFADGVKTKQVPIKIREHIPEPVFTLKVPAAWDGRATVEVLAQVTNLTAMRESGAGDLEVDWKVSGLAVVKETQPGKLILLRARSSGEMVVTATLSNGGKPVERSAAIMVTEPKSDPWLARTADKDEQPAEGGFYARDDSNEGTLHYNGTLDQPADSVFLKVYADGKPFKGQSAKPAADGSYRLAVKLKPGLIKYRVEFGTTRAGVQTVLRRVDDLVCGDAYIIQGQSNALATDTGEASPPETSEWIRSYGRPQGDAGAASGESLWCRPVWKAHAGEKAELGYWGMELAKRLVQSRKIPVFIVNGAAGGTRIDQHQRNPADPTDLTTIYGRMLWRVREAKLTHGIRGILWHQGENDQGAAGPTGGYGWETYEDYFVEMSSGWMRDFPNLQHTYVFQIWPNACSMGGNSGGGDKIRDVQRSLPRLYSDLSVMSTLGVQPPGPCHFPLAGWAEFARMIQPLIERDHHGVIPDGPITPPALKQARLAGSARDEIILEFDQPVIWMDSLAGQFHLDGKGDQIASGSVRGNVLTLKLRTPASAKTITYLKETAWSQDNLILGANGIAALTFCDVPLSPKQAPPR